jgi:hypothetical protein
MAQGDARDGKWRGNWRMEWVASTVHTTSEHGVPSITTITTADVHTSAASSRLNWRPCRFKKTRPFRRKTKSGFCACAITFQTQSTILSFWSKFLQLLNVHNVSDKASIFQPTSRQQCTCRALILLYPQTHPPPSSTQNWGTEKEQGAHFIAGYSQTHSLIRF